MLSFSPCWILTLKLALIYADALQNNHFHSTVTKNTSQEESSDWLLPTISRYNSKLITLPPRPTGHYQNSRWGPYFEEGGEPMNITARVGTTVRMNCKISLLYGKTVTWVHRKGDTINLLTVARQPYSTDQRIVLNFRYPNNWRLEITSVTHRDDGLYECQVATHPPTIKRVYLKITAPEVEIVDEKGHRMTERYYKAGSTIELYCHAAEVQFPDDDLHWWKENNPFIQGIMTNISTPTSAVISSLTILSAKKIHSGNYTCSAGQSASASVSVHILNGELPAAIHDGSSGTSFFMATWLLTLCCIISTYCLPFR